MPSVHSSDNYLPTSKFATKKDKLKKKKIDLYSNDLWFDIFNFYFSFKFLHLTVAVKLVPVQPYDRKYFSVKAANASLFSTANRK